jgi:selenocysteine-specific elongation factor
MSLIYKKLTKEEIDTLDENQIKNINVGIMGHVDSGKTSITKILTTIASTNSLDHNPISQERGITIDIGFSCFVLELLESGLADFFGKKFL